METGPQLPNPVSAYQQALDKLDALLHNCQRSARQDSSRRQITAALEAVFHQRDSLETALTKQPDTAANQVDYIAALDARLVASGERALTITRTNLHAWRSVLAARGEPAWWWSLDTTWGGPTQTFPSLQRLGVYVLSAVALGIALAIITIQTTRLFAQDLNFLGGITLAVQVVIGGSLAHKDIRMILLKLARGLNHLLRLPARLTGPSPLLLFSVLFLTTVLLLNGVILPLLAAHMHALAIAALEAENPGQAEAHLQLAVRLVPDYASSLTQLGILYDGIGDREQAIASFEQALAVDSQLLLARYWLAELNLDVPDEAHINRALRLVDQGLHLVQRHEAGEIVLPVGSSDELVMQRYLLLLSRGRAFIELGRPAGALIDLNEAQRLTEAHPELFIDTAETGGSTGNDMRALSVFDLKWLTALALEMVYDAEPNDENRWNADVAWVTVKQTADPINDSQERLSALVADEH